MPHPPERALFVRHFAFGDVLLTTPFLRMLAEDDRKLQVDLYSLIDSAYTALPSFGRHYPMDRCAVGQAARKHSKVYWFNYEFDRSLHILDGYSLSSGLFPKDRTLAWTVLPEERARAEAVLEGVKRPLVGFLPVCGNVLKNLSLAKTQQLVDLVREELGGTVAVFTDRPLELHGCLNLTDRFSSIRELAAVIACCDVFITIDTGPFHIAQALGVPTVGLFGCTLPELLATRPETLQMVRVEGLPCLGCYHRVPKGQEQPPTCERSDHPCVEMFPGDQVVRAVVNALEGREDGSLAKRVADYQARREASMAQYAGKGEEIAAAYQARILGANHANKDLRLRRRLKRKGRALWERLFRKR